VSLRVAAATEPAAPLPNRQFQGYVAFLAGIPLLRFMSSAKDFWAEACQRASGKPLQVQLDAVYASCGITVRKRAQCCMHVVVLLLIMLKLLLLMMTLSMKQIIKHLCSLVTPCSPGIGILSQHMRRRLHVSPLVPLG
jgi:hypothetical protein